MNRSQRRAHAKQGNRTIRETNKKFGNGNVLQVVTPEQLGHLTDVMKQADMLRVLRSDRFLVQEFAPPKHCTDVVLVRLSINLTALNPGTGRWEDGIAWDELQEVKRQCGYGKHDAVEVFPHDDDVVNVANIRHLWILTGPLPFAWRHDPASGY